MNKYYLEAAARLLSPPLYYSQVYRLAEPMYGGLGQILMFHRVVPASNKLRIHNHKSLEITPERLEEIITFFRKRDYMFISLDELAHIKRGEIPERKFVIFTFDDGYLDNYEFAFPIFKRHQVPFTVYVATSLPDLTAKLWWYMLEDVVVANDSVKLQVEGRDFTFRTITVKEKEIAFNKIRHWFAQADENKLALLLHSLFSGNTEAIKVKTRALSMSWDHIKELSQDPLVTIGSHTVNHFPLDALTKEKSSFEIMESQRIIESHIGKEVRHFCYPLGSHGTKEIEILKKTTYSTATTIKMANLFRENLEYPFSLPRIMINSLTTDKILSLQVSGLLPALRNKLKRVVI